MPIRPTFPGVYIDEVTSQVHTIVGVSTGMTAFVGPAERGPVDEPVYIDSFQKYSQVFGGLDDNSLMSYAVWMYFGNGGQQAQVVRVASGPTTASPTTPRATTASLILKDDAGNPLLTVQALSQGVWANAIKVTIDRTATRALTPDEAGKVTLYNVTIDPGTYGIKEEYFDVSSDPSSPQSIDKMLAGSSVVTCTPPAANKPPAAIDQVALTNGAAGAPAMADYITARRGIYALDDIDIFNILCVPDLCALLDDSNRKTTLELCAQYCQRRRAMLIIDPPGAWQQVDDAVQNTLQKPLVGPDSGKNAAVYFPQIRTTSAGGASVLKPPSGAVAGAWVRTDTDRGVWKAPAGIKDGPLNPASGLGLRLIDDDIGRLNPLAVNCLRTLPVAGPLIWGARTVAGADILAEDQWRYIPVRRLTLFIEESLKQGTQWVVFEPNDEPLWSSIRTNVGSFMETLFRQGAFQGRSARDAYLVQCDANNNPQSDIDRGIVNILVGFAPLKPAEFVFVHIQQIQPAMQPTG